MYATLEVTKTMLQALTEPAHRFPRWLQRDTRVAKGNCIAINGQIFIKDRLFIPPDKELRLQILHRTHGSAPGGHPGNFKTFDLLRRTYYWPQLSRDVAAFVQGCHLCKRTKRSRLQPLGFLDPLPIPFRPWTNISVDYIGPLPECKRHGITYAYVLVVVDRLTKMYHFIPVPDLSAATLADAFVSGVYRLYGSPGSIVSDRGAQFVSTFWAELSRRLGITLCPSTALHPETDGQMEVVNGAMEQYLRCFCGFYQDDWVDWLPIAEFSANNQTSKTIGLSLFFANYGWHP